ncbi:hypothetical protein [Acidimangrovimonas sediminis]|uniref:hypothetical protein n=1 Tax=Acidimangrovimonas sediminis TaxID=2056283 RepID=UPI000C806A55|nr:hypothetical protein [Acidimangrovimonas sediminis]
MPEKSEDRLKLEARATELGVAFAPTIGDEKLAERIAAAEAAKNTPESPKTSGAAQAAADEGAAKGAGQTGSAPTEPAGGAQTSPADGQPVAGDAAGPAAPAAADLSATGATVIVKGPRKGRWRCGRHFGATAVTIPAEELDEDDLAAIEADPALTMTVVDAPY